MIYLRLIIIAVAVYVSYLFGINIYETIFNPTDIMVVDGVLNIWGIYSMFLLGSYCFIYWLNQLITLPVPIGDWNKVALMLLIVITPLLTLGSYSKIQSNISGYVECKDERVFTSRYSSRTYAKDLSLCQK